MNLTILSKVAKLTHIEIMRCQKRLFIRAYIDVQTTPIIKSYCLFNECLMIIIKFHE